MYFTTISQRKENKESGRKSPRGQNGAHSPQQTGRTGPVDGKGRAQQAEGTAGAKALGWRSSPSQGRGRGPGSELSPRVVSSMRCPAQLPPAGEHTCPALHSTPSLHHRVTRMARWKPSQPPPPSDHQHLRQGRASCGLSKGCAWPGVLLTGGGELPSQGGRGDGGRASLVQMPLCLQGSRWHHRVKGNHTLDEAGVCWRERVPGKTGSWAPWPFQYFSGAQHQHGGRGLDPEPASRLT